MCINLTALTETVEQITQHLFDKEQCGWFDGGCMTLASAINHIYPRSIFYHISRSHDVVDHVVIYFPELDSYFDADGMQSKEALIQKMKTLESMANPTLFTMRDTHFEQIKVFADVRDLFVEYYKKQ
ncbi:hypothetical protein [Thalassotalea piscium]|uniref:Uncharacterized protein n=1 Tax=Thalassotalea piscium TaxID=1230533 RepID=A0A7X0TTF5_9GAMM|nr:hypothetical protein [Thalassotalea piscium]MBB6543103.1 hypothetical protein [Thalassotalea piscium]